MIGISFTEVDGVSVTFIDSHVATDLCGRIVWRISWLGTSPGVVWIGDTDG
jgi:hypothetical protein